jgi:NAD-dependent dihydropyrimidine dehydrogenase PreA subunit
MDAVTVVLSLGSQEQIERRAIEEGLRKRLKDDGWPCVVVPDLYLMKEGSCPSELRDLAGPLVVLSWLKPRAAYWALRRLGISGHRASSLGNEQQGSRPIVCLDLSTKCCAGKWVEALQSMNVRRPTEAGSEFREARAETAARWYPIIDYDRCTACGECLEFCLFGVYDTDEEGRSVVSSPESCKPGCPACSRVCPAAAIMFPLFQGDEVIAGADEGSIVPFNHEDIQRVRAACADGTLSQDDVVRACACSLQKPQPSGSRDAPRAVLGEDLDAILDKTVGK